MENQLTKQGFNKLAASHNFIVVYPNGIQNRWDDGRPNITQNQTFYDIDDVGYLTLLIDELSTEFQIQHKYIFFTAISNAGFMCYRLGFEIPEKIKAISPVCATNALDLLNNYTAQGELSIAIMCGTDDPLAPYEGGYITIFNQTRSTITSVNDTVDFWIDNNNCDPTPDRFEYPDRRPSDCTRVIREIYENKINDTVVYLYTIQGIGHTWPGGEQYFPEWLIGKTCRDIDANVVLWDFFSQFLE